MIIGLSGKARAGKDTVAEYLYHTRQFSKVAFADKLKEAAAVLFGFNEAQLYGDKKEAEDFFWKETPRRMLQKFGTECMRRGMRDDFWIAALKRQIEAWVTNHKIADIVITDVRFKNEANAIRQWGGEIIRIERPGRPRQSLEAEMHPSETDLDDYPHFSAIILNDASFEVLHARVEEALSGIQASRGVR